jgi:transportin-3
VIYDLHQVDETNLPGLKTTLLASLQRYHSGPRNIIIQLCLALAALALQYPGCHDIFQTMVDSFGRNPATVPVLLQFLTVLPDELNNTRIPITDDEWTERVPLLLGENRKQLLEILTMYIQASGSSYYCP